ncbi:sensor histidine kinase [Hymenobacter sp. ASUV-10]|uniref:Sensor histidine kinase n=1 Tax=Hymenobacter aranciens TaxID=3063996 RepID=A0ABT9B831_9BACT|nr:sensor histidine kinase [Hymenobacter sp. ASUV-10]MDO7874385.1 sensor histidine kinase [Hymenobacter sp. ASUV-10]
MTSSSSFLSRLVAYVRAKPLAWRLYLVATPWTLPVYGYMYFGAPYLHTWSVFLGGTALFLVMYMMCLTSVTALLSRGIRRYPEPQQAPKRVAYNAAQLAVFIVVGTLGAQWLMDAVHLYGYVYHFWPSLWTLVSVAVVHFVVAGLAEVAYVLSQWRHTQLEAQQLAQQQVQTELDDVKQQVNPHFLFNCLNSLSVLIGEAPAEAELFVDEMATVYRYLLQAHRTSQAAPAEVSLVTLEAELDFLHSYSYLLRTRYGAGLEFCLPATAPGGSLLPLTLQTLVDNAIRHNVASADTPLRIDVRTPAPGYVQVRNTLQKRSVRVPMATQGLSTLQARYQLLGSAGAVRAEATGQHFSVSVQLL